MNIKLIIAYDGTEYLGWQRTKEGPSIEEILQTVLEQILQHPVILQAASRTDAGVHAHGQVVNFITHKSIPDLTKFQISINSLLPKSIVVTNVSHEDDSFHPTLECKGKEYHYHICQGIFQYPEHRNFSWHCHGLLDIEQMKNAAQLLLGTHDFTAFCNAKKNEPYDNCIRTVERIEIIKLPDNRIKIVIDGNNFLYKMVRNIAGTLVYIGNGKIKLEEIINILNSKNRTLAGMTAPAHGLTLYKVKY